MFELRKKIEEVLSGNSYETIVDDYYEGRGFWVNYSPEKKSVYMEKHDKDMDEWVPFLFYSTDTDIEFSQKVIDVEAMIKTFHPCFNSEEDKKMDIEFMILNWKRSGVKSTLYENLTFNYFEADERIYPEYKGGVVATQLEPIPNVFYPHYPQTLEHRIAGFISYYFGVEQFSTDYLTDVICSKLNRSMGFENIINNLVHEDDIVYFGKDNNKHMGRYTLPVCWNHGTWGGDYVSLILEQKEYEIEDIIKEATTKMANGEISFALSVVQAYTDDDESYVVVYLFITPDGQVEFHVVDETTHTYYSSDDIHNETVNKVATSLKELKNESNNT